MSEEKTRYVVVSHKNDKTYRAVGILASETDDAFLLTSHWKPAEPAIRSPERTCYAITCEKQFHTYVEAAPADIAEYKLGVQRCAAADGVPVGFEDHVKLQIADLAPLQVAAVQDPALADTEIVKP